MIDPTTFDFNAFQVVSTPKNPAEQKSTMLPTFLMIFGIFAVTVGIHLYIERHYSNDKI